MERVLALGQDMALLWIRYAPLYLSGVVNTLLLAVAATVLGCLIGLACGLLNTIPIHPQVTGINFFLLKSGTWFLKGKSSREENVITNWYTLICRKMPYG